MQIHDAASKPRGMFRLDIFNCGELIEQYHEENLIVDRGRTNVAQLLAGSANLHISQLGFGVGTAAAAAGNTALTSAEYVAVSVTPPSTSGLTLYQVKFDFVIGSSVGNGKAITEFGLFTASGLLHARKVRTGAINKNSDLTLSGSWLLEY